MWTAIIGQNAGAIWKALNAKGTQNLSSLKKLAKLDDKQLFKEFFPDNAVEYFVSYYDYYQPEAYVPRHDLYIEKETDINEEIERLRLAATTSLMSRKDVIIVASVSCIYGTGQPGGIRQGGDQPEQRQHLPPQCPAAPAGRKPVPAQRYGAAPRHLPRARRYPRDHPGLRGSPRLPHHLLRR